MAVTGVYCQITYAVTQRTGEFGIRMDLGVQRADVFVSMLREGLKMILPGIGLGLTGAASATPLIASKL